jgi:predicted ATPase/DNA-binding SARP family transcriptional activator/Tfp pilus assembly protein PilF
MLTERWKIQLLGGLIVRQGDRTIDRFRTRKGGEMLAALALHANRSLTRQEMLDLLWPDCDPEAGRNRLRVELAALRRQFQSPKQAAIQLIEAYRLTVRLHPEAFSTDITAFEQGLTQAARATERPEQIALLARSVDLYQGDLLPGYDVEWIVAERERLAVLHQEALRRLIRCLAHERDFDRAIAYAQHALQFDAWNEEAHFDLIRLLVAVGQPSAAIRQYETLEQTLREQFAAKPTATAREFIQQVRDRLGHEAGARTAAVAALPSHTFGSASAHFPQSPSPVELPVHLTRFFGREQEQQQVVTLLKENRLVTLTGPGGNGKTRLMVEMAASLKAHFPGGVHFLYLGNLPDVSQLPEALRQTLRLPPQPGKTPLDQVIAALSTTPSLLILDNFEHVADQGAPFVEMLLGLIPQLTVAITSRRVLGITGEQEFPVVPLPTPSEGMPPEMSTTFASVRLFIDRAQAVRPDFQTTSRNAAAIANLCRYLEGIPLALELAAARIRTMTPAQMAERLIPRLELLVNPRADKDARHRSLRTTIAWSVRMLSPAARRFFARLAVFQGGWDMEGAARVCLLMEDEEDSETHRWGAFNLLERLLSESLLIAEERNGVMRFRMLETLREFAWEQLPPPEQERMHRRHACYWMQFGEEIELKLDGPELQDWLNRLKEEHANLTRALTWCLESPTTDLAPSPVEIGLRIMGALWKYWNIRGSAQEGLEFAERLLERSETDVAPKVLARCHTIAAALAKAGSDYPVALAHAEKALAYWRQEGSLVGIGAVLSNIGSYFSEMGNMPEALRYYEEGLSIFRDLGIPWRIATSLNNLGALQSQKGDFEMAQATLEEALTIRREIGDRRAVWSTLNNLAALANFRENYAAAVQGQQEALAIARELEDRSATAMNLVNLGQNFLSLKDYPAAHACFTESLQLNTAAGSRFGQAYALEGLAVHAVLTGRPERAGLLKGAAHSLRLAIQASQTLRAQQEFDAEFLSIAADPHFLEGVQRGSALPLEAAISLAVLPA